MFQVCLCGTQPGYRHRSDCPYPLYRCSSKQEQEWEQAREKKKKQEQAQHDPLMTNHDKL